MKYLTVILILIPSLTFAFVEEIVCKDTKGNTYLFQAPSGLETIMTALDITGKDTGQLIQLRHFSEHDGPVKSISAYGLLNKSKFVLMADGPVDEKVLTGSLEIFGAAVKKIDICCEKDSSLDTFQGCWVGM